MTTIDEMGRRISWDEHKINAHQVSVQDDYGTYVGILMDMLPRPDVTKSGRFINAPVLIKSDADMGEDLLESDAILHILACVITDCLHELTEHFKVDGKQFFKPHGGAGYDNQTWDLLSEIAKNAAAELVFKHPKTEG